MVERKWEGRQVVKSEIHIEMERDRQIQKLKRGCNEKKKQLKREAEHEVKQREIYENKEDMERVSKNIQTRVGKKGNEQR